jgi:hypothetical protein
MWGNTGNALLLLLIVRNFQYGFCDDVTAKFVTMPFFSFDEWGLLEAASGPSSASGECRMVL